MRKPGGRIRAPSITAASGLLACSLVMLATGCGESYAEAVQPLRFSHAVHAEEDMACVDCHLRAEDGPYATTPGVATCMLCHEEAQGEDPEEPKVREYAESEQPIPWVRVNRVVGHVYFSHGVHVKLARLDCAQCHGDMAALEQPVTRSQVEWLTMDACMECHERSGASNDCLGCHK